MTTLLHYYLQRIHCNNQITIYVFHFKNITSSDLNKIWKYVHKQDIKAEKKVKLKLGIDPPRYMKIVAHNNKDINNSQRLIYTLIFEEEIKNE